MSISPFLYSVLLSDIYSMRWKIIYRAINFGAIGEVGGLVYRSAITVYGSISASYNDVDYFYPPEIETTA